MTATVTITVMVMATITITTTTGIRPRKNIKQLQRSYFTSR